jgi:hypothetical protein
MVDPVPSSLPATMPFLRHLQRKASKQPARQVVAHIDPRGRGARTLFRFQVTTSGRARSARPAPAMCSMSRCTWQRSRDAADCRDQDRRLWPDVEHGDIAQTVDPLDTCASAVRTHSWSGSIPPLATRCWVDADDGVGHDPSRLVRGAEPTSGAARRRSSRPGRVRRAARRVIVR